MIFSSTHNVFFTCLRTFILMLFFCSNTTFSYAQVDPSAYPDFDPSLPYEWQIPSISQNNTDMQSDFTVFDEMRFKNKPRLDHLNMQGIRVVYVRELWPNRIVKQEIDEQFMSKYFEREEFRFANMVCINIEHWPVDLRKYDSSIVRKNIAKYEKVIELFKEKNPSTLIGIYGVLPIRDYYSPVRDKNISDWQQANDELFSLADKVDVIFPSIYTFFKDESSWKKYAIGNINEAKRYGKAVYPFIWPQYHHSNKLMSLDYIGSKFWKVQLETVYKHADGVVIWTPSTNSPNWNNNAKWWQTTEAFINDIGL